MDVPPWVWILRGSRRGGPSPAGTVTTHVVSVVQLVGASAPPSDAWTKPSGLYKPTPKTVILWPAPPAAGLTEMRWGTPPAGARAPLTTTCAADGLVGGLVCGVLGAAAGTLPVRDRNGEPVRDRDGEPVRTAGRCCSDGTDSATRGAVEIGPRSRSAASAPPKPTISAATTITPTRRAVSTRAPRLRCAGVARSSALLALAAVGMGPASASLRLRRDETPRLSPGSCSVRSCSYFPVMVAVPRRRPSHRHHASRARLRARRAERPLQLPRAGQSGKLESMTVAFALSGGGNLGPLQAGTVLALVESGIEADLFVGTSVGALNAAFLVTRPGAVGARELVSAWSELKRRDVVRLSPLRALAGFLGVRDHLVSTERLRSLIRRWVELTRIEDAPTRLAITATDALSGESVTMTEGDIVESLVASAAIPGLFPPVAVGGRWLVDGSLSASRPVRQAQDLGARDVYVVTTATAPRHRPPRGAVGVAMNSVSLVTSRIARRETEEAALRARADGGRVFVVPSAQPAALGTFDYRHGGRLAKAAYERTRAWLDAGPSPLEPSSPLLEAPDRASTGPPDRAARPGP